jgi:hypothetical protein
VKKIEHQFYQTSKSFCEWAERKANKQGEEERVLLQLAELYCLGLQLPFPEPSEDEHDCRPTLEDTEPIYQGFSSLSPGYYSEVADAHEVPTDKIVTGDLHDDLRDIYSDLKEGLLLYEAGNKNDAFWSWKNSFISHWSRHAASAIKILNQSVFSP